MQLADITQLRTQAHVTAGLLQPRSQRLVAEDGAVGLARPGRPGQASRGWRRPRGCQHASHKCSPRVGSVGDHPSSRSKVRAGRFLGMGASRIRGGMIRPGLIGDRNLLGA